MGLRRKASQRGLQIASYNRLKEKFGQGLNSCSGGTPSPCTLGTARVPASQATVPPSCSTLTRAELPRPKYSSVFALSFASGLSDSFLPWRLWQDSLSGRGFSMQESWSVLANTDCHALLEHYISRCPYCQTPEHTALARTSVTQSAAPPPHLALKGANPRTPRQPQEQTPVDKPHAEMDVKPP